MRIACASIGDDVTEDVEAAGDVDEEGSGICAGGRITSNGTSGGKAESVAVVKCWFGVRRHAFTACTRASGSGICRTERRRSRGEVSLRFSHTHPTTPVRGHAPLGKRQRSGGEANERKGRRTSAPASNSACSFVIASIRASMSAPRRPARRSRAFPSSDTQTRTRTRRGGRVCVRANETRVKRAPQTRRRENPKSKAICASELPRPRHAARRRECVERAEGGNTDHWIYTGSRVAARASRPSFEIVTNFEWLVGGYECLMSRRSWSSAAASTGILSLSFKESSRRVTGQDAQRRRREEKRVESFERGSRSSLPKLAESTTQTSAHHRLPLLIVVTHRNAFSSVTRAVTCVTEQPVTNASSHVGA